MQTIRPTIFQNPFGIFAADSAMPQGTDVTQDAGFAIAEKPAVSNPLNFTIKQFVPAVFLTLPTDALAQQAGMDDLSASSMMLLGGTTVLMLLGGTTVLMLLVAYGGMMNSGR